MLGAFGQLTAVQYSATASAVTSSFGKFSYQNADLYKFVSIFQSLDLCQSV